MVSGTVRFKKSFLLVPLLLVALTIGGVMLVRGGGTEDASPPEAVGFSYDVAVTYGELSFTGRLIRPAAGQCVLEVNSPAVLKGMRFTLDENGASVSYRGLQLPPESTGLPDTGFFEPFTQAMDAIVQTELTAEKHLSGIRYRGSIPIGGFVLLCDPNGRILSLELPAYALTVTMSNQTPLTA